MTSSSNDNKKKEGGASPQLQASTQTFTKEQLFTEFAEAEFTLNQIVSQMSNKQLIRGLKAWCKIGMGKLEVKPKDQMEQYFVMSMFQLDQIKTMIFSLMEGEIEQKIEEKANENT